MFDDNELHQSNFIVLSKWGLTFIDEVLSNDRWIVMMHKDLNQFLRNEFKMLYHVLRKKSIGAKWVYKNKFDEGGKSDKKNK